MHVTAAAWGQRLVTLLQVPSAHYQRLGATEPPGRACASPQEEIGPTTADGTSTSQLATPAFAYPLLVAAVLAVSSAASAFSKMHDVPAVTLAAWRLQLTAVLLGCCAVHQYRRMAPSERSRALRSWRLLLCSGTCLAAHFGFWVWGLQHTSLTHSLLMVSATPVLLAVGALALRLPISRGEVLGALLGLAGAIVLAAGAASTAAGGGGEGVGLAGDIASFMAAVVFVGYLSVGRTLRQWMPIFVYAFPVTGCAALMLTAAGLALEPVSFWGSGSQGSFGWLSSARHLPWVVYLALGPGIVGHTGFNTLLRYLTPLTVSLAFQLEPLVGSAIGWAAGVISSPPGALTWAGGALVLAATAWVTVANAERERREAAAEAAEAGPGLDAKDSGGREVGLAMQRLEDGGASGAAAAEQLLLLPPQDRRRQDDGGEAPARNSCRNE